MVAVTVIAAWLPVWGSLRLIALRVVVQVLVALPTLAAMDFGSMASRPWFAEAKRGLPWVLPWLQTGLDGLTPWVGLAVLLSLLLDQVVTAGAIRWLDPDAEHGRFQLVGPAVIGEGTRWLWPQLRVVALAAVVGAAWIGAGSAAVFAVTELPFEPLRLGGLAAVAVGLLVIGAFSHMAQVVTVGDERRVVRRALWLSAKLAWRHPFAGPLLTVLASAAVVPLPALALAGWRLAGPGAEWPTWALTWLAALGVQAFVWHGLIRVVWALFAHQTDLRSTPDEGFGLWASIGAKLRPKDR